MAQDRIPEQVAGVVACSNPKGFQLAHRDGWLNVSKFSAGVEVPAKGQCVEVGLDKAGFVGTVEAIGERVTSAMTGGEPVSGSATREQQITRMACLNTVTAVLASGGRMVEPESAISIAGRLEAWVTR